ncbi:MAG: hypothetical protein AAGD33_01960 [Actinomycetota bacterium]
MPRALVHIGLGKTGTTSIQSALVRLRDGPGLGPVRYPSLARRTDHAMLSVLYKPYDRLARGIRAKVDAVPGGYEATRAAVRDEFQPALSSGDDLILSTEFFDSLSGDEVARFVDELTRAGYDEIAVLVYLRGPAPLYLSRTQQLVKASGSIVPPDRFRFGYRSRVEVWADRVNRLFVRAVEPGADDVVEDALSVAERFFGIALARPAVARENSSLSSEGMILLQRYRRIVHADRDDQFLPDSNRLLDVIRAVESEHGNLTQARLAGWASDAVAAVNAEDLAWLAEQHDLDLRGASAEAVDRPRPVTAVLDVADVLDEWSAAGLELLTHRVMALLLRDPSA